MTTAIVNVSSDTSTRGAACAALRNAGLQVLELDSWDEADAALRRDESAVLVCDAKTLRGRAPPRDLARQLSHDLRTPLSAMAGWLHLLEIGKLDEAGTKRALEKLRGNIDDQVKTIEKFLGAQQEGPRT